MGSNRGPYGRPWPTSIDCFQADQEVGPLRTAVMHEFDFLSPSAMFEQQRRLPCQSDERCSACISPCAGRDLDCDMSGERKLAKPAGRCPRDGGVRGHERTCASSLPLLPRSPE